MSDEQNLNSIIDKMNDMQIQVAKVDAKMDGQNRVLEAQDNLLANIQHDVRQQASLDMVNALTQRIVVIEAQKEKKEETKNTNRFNLIITAITFISLVVSSVIATWFGIIISHK